jgi:uncharacterized protein (DUF1697 family)
VLVRPTASHHSNIRSKLSRVWHASAVERNVALLRGINVGTSKRIAMPALRATFEALGATDVETYLQSGNVVFSGSLKPADIEAAVAGDFGVSPRVIVLTAAEFRRVADDNPMTGSDPSRLFVFFMEAVPASIEVPEGIEPEEVVIGKHAVYQSSPDGIGRSKIPPRFTKSLGPTATARNLRTVDALLAMLDA